jgi:hypothetical protein
MSENFHPFKLETAKDALEGDGDFLLPVCEGEPDLMTGEDVAIIVLTTVGDQRVGLPIGMQGLSDLHLPFFHGLHERCRAPCSRRFQARARDLTGWLWAGLIERISLDQRSWE